MTHGIDSTRTSDALRSLVGDYDIDPMHSRLGISIRYAMAAKVRGSFPGFTGGAHVDAEVARSSTTITVETATFSTNLEARDTHTRSADLLDVATFPEITFRSTFVTLVGETTFRIGGDLTIRDVTRPVTVDFEFLGLATDQFGNVRAGFEGSTSISRGDFGITYNYALTTGGVLISDKVDLEFEISAIRRTGSVTVPSG